MSREAAEIVAIVEQFPAAWRQKFLNSTARLAEVYRALGAQRLELHEMRRQYREAHPDEQEGDRCTVIRLADRRRVS